VKDWKDLQNLIPHGIKFDDQADDEFLVRAPQVFADDELIIAPTDQFGRIKPYPSNIRFDEEADNELATLPYRDYNKFLKDFPRVPIEHQVFDDDELMTLPYKDWKKFHFPGSFPGELQNQRADDELVTLPYRDFNKLLKDYPLVSIERQPFDDELVTLPYKDYTKFFKDYKLPIEVQDKRVDDELVTLPYREPLLPILKKFQFPKMELQSDDELVLLKDLLKPERHVAIPRDELRVFENPKLRGGAGRAITLPN